MALEMVRVDEWRCEIEMVVDEKVVEENERDESCTGASTPDEVHSTEAVAEHKSEMNEQLVGHNMDL